MMLCYMPTVALTNAVCFHQMSDAGSEFPTVRVFGTIGWIAAGWLVGMLGIESTALPMKIAACASVLTGVFAFFLPHTPPRAAGQRMRIADVLGLNALALLRDRSFAVFAIGSLLVSIPLAFYYNFANLFLNEIGMQNAAGKMTFGQMSEIVFMLLMPFFFRHLGVKKMLLVAIAAWALRYALLPRARSGCSMRVFYCTEYALSFSLSRVKSTSTGMPALHSGPAHRDLLRC